MSALADSFLAALQSLQVRFNQIAPHALAGKCPHGAGQITIDTSKPAWRCDACDASGEDAMSLAKHIKGKF